MNDAKPKLETAQQRSQQYDDPTECIIYWDFDTNPIPNGQQLRYIINSLNDRISNKIGSKPIQFRIYTCSTKVSNKLQDDFDINGIQHIITSSTIIDSVNKRILIDILLKLYELSNCQRSNCIGLISNNNTFAYLLSKIHNEPPISYTILISFNSKLQINQNLANNVDFVIRLTNSPNSNLKRITRDYNNMIQTPVSKKQKINNNQQEIDIILQNMATKQKIPAKVWPNARFRSAKSTIKKQMKCSLKSVRWFINGRQVGTNKRFRDFSIKSHDIIQFQATPNRKKKKNINQYYSMKSERNNDSNSVEIAVQIIGKYVYYRKCFIFNGSKRLDRIKDQIRCIYDPYISIMCIDGKNIMTQTLKNMSVWWNGIELVQNIKLVEYNIKNNDVIVFCIDVCMREKAKNMSVMDAVKHKNGDNKQICDYICNDDENTNNVGGSDNEDDDICVDREVMEQSKRNYDVTEIVKMPDLERVYD
eukprot:471573_1